MFRRLHLAAPGFPISADDRWVYGSGEMPKHYFSGSPFPELSALSLLTKNKYEWSDKSKDVSLVPVKELYSWQQGTDPEKLAPLKDPGYEPILVSQIQNKLCIMNGNHRATDAFIQGLRFVKAIVTNFDDLKAKRYRKDKGTFHPYPLHPGVIPYSASRVFEPG